MAEDHDLPPFGFPISRRVPPNSGPAALESFVKAQIEALLDVVVLTRDGKPVHVDGFLWLKDAFRRTTDAPQIPIRLTSVLDTGDAEQPGLDPSKE